MHITAMQNERFKMKSERRRACWKYFARGIRYSEKAPGQFFRAEAFLTRNRYSLRKAIVWPWLEDLVRSYEIRRRGGPRGGNPLITSIRGGEGDVTEPTSGRKSDSPDYPRARACVRARAQERAGEREKNGAEERERRTAVAREGGRSRSPSEELRRGGKAK